MRKALLVVLLFAGLLAFCQRADPPPARHVTPVTAVTTTAPRTNTSARSSPSRDALAGSAQGAASRTLDDARAARAPSSQHGPSGPPPRLPAGKPQGIESLPPATLDALKTAIPDLEKCFPSGSPKAPIVLVTVEGDSDLGMRADPALMTDGTGAPIDLALADCLHTTLQSLHVPPLAEGTSVQIQYSFRL